MKTKLSAFRKMKACVLACVVGSVSLSGCASRSQYQKGYDRGAGDTVKHQYWVLQNMQKRAEPKEKRLTYYRLPVLPDPNSPVKTVPYEIAIPIHE